VHLGRVIPHTFFFSPHLEAGASFLIYAEDGTSCHAGEESHAGVCLAGKCAKVGCDGRVESGGRAAAAAAVQVEDACGTCGGDGQSCRKTVGVKALPLTREYL